MACTEKMDLLAGTTPNLPLKNLTWTCIFMSNISNADTLIHTDTDTQIHADTDTISSQKPLILYLIHK